MTAVLHTPLSVSKTAHARAPRAIAFDVFTARIGTWWPMATHHIGLAECVEVVIEPRVGGRWFERGTDGSECDWGRVLAWEAPSRVVLAWQLDAQWKFDPTLQTEVEVRFIVVDAENTRIELEHRGLEAYGSAAATMREVLGSPNGWSGMLDHYAQVAGR